VWKKENILKTDTFLSELIAKVVETKPQKGV